MGCNCFCVSSRRKMKTNQSGLSWWWLSKNGRARKMAHWAQCSMHKHEDQSLNPQQPHTKPGVSEHTYNPGTEGTETGGLY